MLGIFQTQVSSYQEIVDVITQAVREGEVEPGQELPSVRSLAQKVGVNPGTVALAYRTLRERSIITTAQGRKSRISRIPVSQRAIEVQVPAGVKNLAVVGPDPLLLPDVNAIVKRGLFRPTLYDVEHVDPGLRRIMEEQFASDGVQGELTVTSGALDAFERIAQVHLKPGDAVIVEDPSWSSALNLIQALGLEPVGASVDDEGITPEALEKALASRRISALLVTTRAQNPFGSALTERRAHALRAVLEKYPHVIVVEDDHAALITQCPPFTLTAGRTHYAVIRSMNKALGPDLRISIMMSDLFTADAVQRRMFVGAGWVSHFTQRITAALLEDSGVSQQIAHARDTYEHRRNALLDALNERGIEAYGVSGLNVAVPVSDETALVSHLLLHGWVVRAGAHFRIDTTPFVRICTSTLDPAEAVQLADAIVKLLSPSRKVSAP